MISPVSKKDKRNLNTIKSKGIIEKIKANYFLRKLFNYLSNKTTLKIFKYNENLQKKINRYIFK